MRYYVQHGAGLGGLVADAVRADLGAVDIVFQDDSGPVLDSPETPEQVARLRYVQNAFPVLASVPRGQLPGSAGSTSAVAAVWSSGSSAAAISTY